MKLQKSEIKITATGTKLFMPTHDVIETCVNKYKSYLKWENSDIKVARNILIHNEEDLKRSFVELADNNDEIWLRASSIGGGGKGALPTNDVEFAKKWIDKYNGWGDFIAAEMLTPDSNLAIYMARRRACCSPDKDKTRLDTWKQNIIWCNRCN